MSVPPPAAGVPQPAGDRYARYPSLERKVVFVTGGGSGIGASIVEHFCAQGALVAFVDIDDAASTALQARIGTTGHPAPRFDHCDLRDVAFENVEIGATNG